ncbi:thermonuclease family protein [Desertivirga brevis]|uniref:thermonuclease family protein n=1 Tax=Desertivirga brevis TaxID=2810310 RepID=UPI001A96CA7E|nr:thermonuclease family protein [Pedobacter sp. SYSU D00873]
MMKFLIAFIFSLISLTVDPPVSITGRVVSIADGDTFTILTNNKKQVKIRLYGVDCPEKKQDFGTKAQQFTSKLCFGKTVIVQVKNNDRYGRKIAIVNLPDGKILNKELLIAGMAWHYKQYDKSREYAELELKARGKRVGIWSSTKPVAPWEFRKNGRRQQIQPNKRKSYIPCSGVTRAGNNCKNNASEGGRCWQHRFKTTS